MDFKRNYFPDNLVTAVYLSIKKLLWHHEEGSKSQILG